MNHVEGAEDHCLNIHFVQYVRK